MAVEELLQKDSIAVVLNFGTSQGKTITKNLSIGTLDKDEYDATKVMSIVDALEPCLSKGIEEVLHTRRTKLVYN